MLLPLIVSTQLHNAYARTASTPGTLGHCDLLRRCRCCLRDLNGQHSILQACLDTILVDTRWERERPVEFANRPFADPVSVISVLVPLTGIGRAVLALRLSLYDQRVRVGEFDVYILLRDSGHFTVQVVRFLCLADVKSRSERSNSRGCIARGDVVSVVIEETEKGAEFSLRPAWNERHGSDRNVS